MFYTNNLSPKVIKNEKKYLSIIKKILKKSIFINGNETYTFENNLKKYLKINYCLSCANGTDALEIAFKALGLKKGDKVFIAGNAGMYSAISLMQIGIAPNFFEIDKHNYGPLIQNINNLPKKTKAIVITHLYGKINKDIIKIKNFCLKNNILLIEDCAQAIGTKINDKKAGTFGDVATFSFFPTKNLGALGDGGAIIFKNKKIYQKAKMIKQYGWKKKYFVKISQGQNSRLDEMQAAILSFELQNLEKNNKKRIAIAQTYKGNIKNKNVFVPEIKKDFSNNYHLFVVFVKNRKSLIDYLRKKKIYTQIHYPIPDFQQTIFPRKIRSLKLNTTIEISKEILSLPCYPELKKKDVIYISKIINSWKN